MIFNDVTINRRFAEWVYCVMWASLRGQAAVVDLLLQRGAQIDLQVKVNWIIFVATLIWSLMRVYVTVWGALMFVE